MIPKIAHFHWAGKPMNWLRWASLRTFEKFHPDYEIRIIRTPDDIRERCDELGLSYAHQADWSWYRALATTGGWQIATDVVFVSRIPDEWNERDLCVCTNGTKHIYQFAAMGACAGNRFFALCDERCRAVVSNEIGYQGLGVDMLQAMNVPSQNNPQPMDSFCPIQCDSIPLLWSYEALNLPPNVVGVHWYGGHEMSKHAEWNDPESSDSAIVRLAKEMLE